MNKTTNRLSVEQEYNNAVITYNAQIRAENELKEMEEETLKSFYGRHSIGKAIDEFMNNLVASSDTPLTFSIIEIDGNFNIEFYILNKDYSGATFYFSSTALIETENPKSFSEDDTYIYAVDVYEAFKQNFKAHAESRNSSKMLDYDLMLVPFWDSCSKTKVLKRRLSRLHKKSKIKFLKEDILDKQKRINKLEKELIETR